LKSDNIQTQGTIIQRHGGDCFRVKIANSTEILCYMTARFKIPAKRGRGMRRPRITIGDKVKVEIDKRDFSKGLLVGFSK